MTHARQSIREAAATLLTGLTTTGSRVHQSRLPYATLGDGELPALLVTTENESVADRTITAAAVLQRELDLIVSGLAKPSANLDDSLDTIAAEVEAALGESLTVSTSKLSVLLQDIKVAIDSSLERDVGRIDLAFRVIYFTAAGAPGTLL